MVPTTSSRIAYNGNGSASTSPALLATEDKVGAGVILDTPEGPKRIDVGDLPAEAFHRTIDLRSLASLYPGPNALTVSLPAPRARPETRGSHP